MSADYAAEPAVDPAAEMPAEPPASTEAVIVEPDRLLPQSYVSRYLTVEHWLPVLIVVPWLLIEYIMQIKEYEREALQKYAFIAAAFGIAGLLTHRFTSFKGPRSAWLTLLFVGTSVWTWCEINDWYMAWGKTVLPSKDMFVRSPVYRLTWPNYGFAWAISQDGKDNDTLQRLGLAGAAVVGGVWLLLVAGREYTRKRWLWPSLILTCGVMAAVAFGLAVSGKEARWNGDMTIRVWSAMYDYAGSVSELLANFNEEQQAGKRFGGTHYPPGSALIFGPWGPVYGKYLNLGLVALTPLLTYLAGRVWGLSARPAFFAAALVAVNGELLMQMTLFGQVIVTPLAALGILLTGLAVGPAKPLPLWVRIPSAALLGAMCVGYALFTFSVGFWALSVFLGLVTLWIWRGVRLTPLLLAGGVALVSALLAGWLFYVVAGYDTYEALRVSMDNHYQYIHVTKGPETPSLERSILVGLGNIGGFWTAHTLAIAYACFGAFGVLWTRFRARKLLKNTENSQSADTSKIDRAFVPVAALGIGTLLCMPISGYAGTFLLETERIWLYLVPGLALAGAAFLERARRAEGPFAVLMLLAVSFITAVATEYYYQNHWA